MKENQAAAFWDVGSLLWFPLFPDFDHGFCKWPFFRFAKIWKMCFKNRLEIRPNTLDNTYWFCRETREDYEILSVLFKKVLSNSCSIPTEGESIFF